VSPGTGWTAGQLLAAEQLRALAEASDGAIELIGGPTPAWLGSYAQFDVSLDLHGLPHVEAGIEVRARERFLIDVPPQFPFRLPTVRVRHTRWAGTAHVQWRRLLCLYAAPSTRWVPGDGMRGYIGRLKFWLEKAALGQLDPDDQPLHPPVAYVLGGGKVVVRPDLGDRVPWAVEPGLPVRALLGLCEQDGDRLDIVAWMDVDTYKRRVDAGDPPVDADGIPYVAAAVVLLSSVIAFEYPDEARELADGLTAAGLSRDELLELVGVVAHGNTVAAGRSVVTPGDDAGAPAELPEGPGGAPLLVLVGTPSRRVAAGGPRLAHLVAWRLDDLGGKITALLGDVEEGVSARLDEIRRDVK